MDLRLPATDAPASAELTESERIGDAYAVIGLDARRQVVTLFRPALDRLGAVTNASLAERRSGSGPDRRPGRDPPAPDDGEGHGLPGPRGRDRDGQRHALAGHLGAAARRRPPPRPAAGRRGAPARGRGGQRDRRDRSGHSPRWPPRPAGRTSRPASASSGMPGCAGWAKAARERDDLAERSGQRRAPAFCELRDRARPAVADPLRGTAAAASPVRVRQPQEAAVPGRGRPQRTAPASSDRKIQRDERVASSDRSSARRSPHDDAFQAPE